VGIEPACKLILCRQKDAALQNDRQFRTSSQQLAKTFSMLKKLLEIWEFL